jgi:hypothetical protein
MNAPRPRFFLFVVSSERPPAIGKKMMFKSASFIGLVAGLALLSNGALAQQGTSSSWGSVGWGPVIPTQSLTPKERQWNFDNQAKYEAQDSAEWLRVHGKGPFSFFR